MIEHDIFIKKCKNCERFFIPMRRVDAEYCNRIYGDTQKRCNEIGAILRYEKKVAENPVWEAYKKAYRRFNSRTRAKKKHRVSLWHGLMKPPKSGTSAWLKGFPLTSLWLGWSKAGFGSQGTNR